MARPRFEWDKRKAIANLQKHGVSFAEAETVFYDESARLIDGPDHSMAERRFVLLGLSFVLRVLAVHHTYREGDGAIRLISARKATRAERAYYEHRRRS
jgi:hypothetical protein